MNYETKLEGTYTALITPFKDNGEVNYGKIVDLVNYQLKSGIDGILTLVTTSTNMVDTFNTYLAKVKTCHKNIFGVKRASKKTIIFLKILKTEVKVKKDLTQAQKSTILRKISKRMLELM